MRGIFRTRKIILVAALMAAFTAATACILLSRSPQKSRTTSHATTNVPQTATPQSTAPSTPPLPTSKILFHDALDGQSRIVTNEYVHWSKSGHCPYTSNLWDMTSGTLLVKDGAGYSGVPTIEKSVPCQSENQNNSAIFRLNTRQSDFSEVTVSLEYKPVRHGGGNAPNNDYDGLHVWVGYQNEYALYAATIFRWDNNIVTKKKVPVEQAGCAKPSNQGCYYDLSKEQQMPNLMTPNVWHTAVITYRTLADDSVSIQTAIDGTVAAIGIDNQAHGVIYPKGAVGLRGDNTEFYVKNFTVTAL